MIGLGHRGIGCTCNSFGNYITPNYLRFLGYKQALEAHGIPFDSNLVSSINSSQSGYEFGFQMMKGMLTRNRDITSVVTMADIMAVGAAKAIFSEGLRIPEDISSIGFDGIEAAEYYQPGIDTISQPAQQMAQMSVEAMMEMLQTGNTIHEVLESTLLKRGSSNILN